MHAWALPIAGSSYIHRRRCQLLDRWSSLRPKATGAIAPFPLPILVFIGICQA